MLPNEIYPEDLSGYPDNILEALLIFENPFYDDLPDFETLCAHLGEDPSKHQGAVVPPIYQNSLFTFPNTEARMNRQEGVFDYTRVSNPTTEIVETKIAAMEMGDVARCFGSGMAAISGAILSCVKSGDHVVSLNTAYGPTRQFLSEYLPRFGVMTTFIDGREPEEWERSIQSNTTLFMLESPSSFVMYQQDLEAIAKIARSHGVSTICDNSWASPFFQSPLKLGIDLVAHSATKYLGGHSDIVAGVVIGNKSRMQKLINEEGCLLGATLDPFASWLMLRGLRTLPIRMERHQENATEIANRLCEHPAVKRVFYPGTSHDNQIDLTSKQLRGKSGLLSFEMKDGSREAAMRTVDALKLYGIGCSWGGFESLALPVSIPTSVIEPGKRGFSWLVRLHIGLENKTELFRDLESSLSM